MPESDSQMVQTLLYIVVGLLMVVLVMAFGVRRRLSRIERRLDARTRPVESGSSPPAFEESAGGAFELFLSEDPSRKELPKSEQFAAFRKWRQKQGLNWSNS